MTRRTDDGIAFEPPHGWMDKTMIAFAAPEHDVGHTANLVMTSEPFREGDSLRTHVDRQVLEAAKQLRNFELLETREGTLGGLPSMTARFSWTALFGDLEQTITSVERVVNGARIVTSVTTTTTANQVDRARLAFDEFLANLRFEGVYASPSHIETKPEAQELMPLVPMPGLGRVGRRR